MYTQFEAFSHLYRKLIDQHIVENKLKDKLLKAMECIQKINESNVDLFSCDYSVVYFPL